MNSHSGEQVNSLGSCFPVKGMSYERNVICLESNEDMILALAGQFKQLSHEAEKFRLLNIIKLGNPLVRLLRSVVTLCT